MLMRKMSGATSVTAGSMGDSFEAGGLRSLFLCRGDGESGDPLDGFGDDADHLLLCKANLPSESTPGPEVHERGGDGNHFATWGCGGQGTPDARVAPLAQVFHRELDFREEALLGPPGVEPGVARLVVWKQGSDHCLNARRRVRPEG